MELAVTLGTPLGLAQRTKPAAEPRNSIPDSNKSVSIQEEQPAPLSEKGGINGYHVSDAINDTESVDSLSEGVETLLRGPCLPRCDGITVGAEPLRSSLIF